MKTLFLIPIFILMLSCDIGPNHGYGFGFDVETPLGIKLRNDTANDVDIQPSIVDAAAYNIFNCVNSTYGYTSTFDQIRWSVLYIVQEDFLLSGNIANGEYYVDEPPLIALLAGSNPARTHHILNTMRHEMVHFILDEMSKPNSHYMTAFTTCV